MPDTNVLSTARRIRRQLSKGFRNDVAILQGAVTSADTTLLFDQALPLSMATGAILSAGTETMLVRTVNRDANSVAVRRGFHDTTAQAHADAAIIDIGAEFTLVDVVDAMSAEISAWGQQLYYPLADTLAVATDAVTYELPAAWIGMMGVIELLQSEDVGDANVWPRIDAKLIRGIGATFDDAPTSGLLLRFTEPIRTGSIYITVAMPYDGTLTTTTDLVTDTLLTEGLVDLLEFGTKRRLMIDQHNGRSARQAQDESRRAEETPLGALAPISQLQQMQYNRRMQEERAVLARRYPLRIV